MIIDNLFNSNRTVVEGSAANDYFTRRKSEEERIAGIKAPARNKKNPANTDYAKRRKQQDVTEAGHDHRRRAAATHDDEECSSCDGTGEGRHEGQSCGACGGSGVARGHYDHDDFEIPDKDDMYEGMAEGSVAQLPTRGADYSKYDTDHLKMMLRPGILHRDEARFKALIRKELQKREQQSQQGVAEAFPNPGSGSTGSSKEDKRIAAALRKKHIPTTPNNKKGQGVAEGSLNEFAVSNGDYGGGGDDSLFNYAKMWYNGDLKTQRQVEKALQKNGLDIGENEDENGGAYISDKTGDYYESWTSEDLEQGVAEGLTEMDKSQTPPGRDTGPRSGPDQYVKPITSKQMQDRALDKLTRAAKDSHKKKDVKESDTLMMKLKRAMVREGRVKELTLDLKTMNDADFMKKYGKAKAAIRADMKKVDEGNANSGRRNPIARPDNVPVKLGRIKKLKTGIEHHADSSRYGGYEPEHDDDQLLTTQQRWRLNKAVTPDHDMDEARMSAAQRLSTAWDRQRAKSDASLRRTPSSIPKKEEPKKADPVPKTVSEHRVKRRALMAQMLNSR